MPIEGVRATGPAMDPGSRLPDPAPQTRSDSDPAEFGSFPVATPVLESALRHRSSSIGVSLDVNGGSPPNSVGFESG